MKTDLTKCPGCGGLADNGHDRCYPPNPYYCSKCEAKESGTAMTTDTPLDDYAGHTPGEWHVDPRFAFRIVADGDCTVANSAASDTLRASWEANARLIADAPKLLQRARTLERDLAECRAALAELVAAVDAEIKARNGWNARIYGNALADTATKLTAARSALATKEPQPAAKEGT